MSTLAVVKKDGFVAIAADSLTKWGSAKESAEYVVNHDKIVQVGDSFLAFSAPTSVRVIAQDYFRGLSSQIELNTVSDIFLVWLKFHGALKEKYFLSGLNDPNEDIAFESSRMDVLIANPAGIFGVGAHRAVQEFSKFYAYGTGWKYALGAMRVAYESHSSAEQIARIGVEVAIDFDDSSGGPVTSRQLALRTGRSKTSGTRNTRARILK